LALTGTDEQELMRPHLLRRSCDRPGLLPYTNLFPTGPVLTLLPGRNNV
jgi:hypothetical protein